MAPRGPALERLLNPYLGAPAIPAGFHRLFSPNAVTRGCDYFQQGRVLGLNVFPEQHHVAASVRGSERRPYHCRVAWRRHGDGYSWSAICTCPVGRNCKHAAAMLFKALPDLPPDVAASLDAAAAPATPATSTAPTAPATPATPRPIEDLQLESWLGELRKQLAPAQSIAGPDAPEQICYLLDTDPAGYARRSLQLRTVIVRPRKSGGYSRPQAFGGSLHAPARFVRPEDHEILHECRVRQSSYHVRLTGEWGARMLHALLATGRTHWREPARALREGPVRAGSFRWNLQPDGKQRLELAVEGALTLPVAPPWYFDEKSGELGPIETGLPDALAEEMLHAPALAGSQAQSLAVALPAVLGAHARHVPLPVPVEVIERRGVKPVRCLRLMPDTVVDDYGGDEDRDCARLWFEYEGIHCNPDEPGSEIARTEGNRVLRIARDAEFERKAHAELVRAGLEPVTPLDGGHGVLFAPAYRGRWLEFLDVHLPRLRHKGWRIETDPDFSTRLLEPDAEWAAEITASGQQWFDLALDITVDGQRQPLLPILVGLLRGRNGLNSVQDVANLKDEAPLYVAVPTGAYLKLPAARIKPILTTLLELFDERPLGADGRLRLPRLAAAALPDLAGADGRLRFSGAAALLELADKLRHSRGIVDVAPPTGLRAALRPYQQQGLNWLQFLREHELGGVLADDMGLGKTVQALAHLLLEKESGRMDRPSLVVAPTSLIFNWQHEAQRFAPSLRVLALQGLKRKSDFERIAGYDLILTTYPLLPRDFEVLGKQDYHVLILDEAQMVKNAKSKAAQLVRGLTARQRLCLTGTPMENHLGEIWALMDFLAPGFLGDSAGFKRRYRTPIEKRGDALAQKHLSRRIAPFLLRRTKGEVAQELPPRTDIVRSVALAGAQRELYETVRVAMDRKVRDEIARRGLARSHIMILDALLKLRQICCDPRLLKMNAAKAVRESAKLDLLMDLLPGMIEEGRRVLLFSQFTSMLDLIKPALEQRGIPYAELTGDTRDRAAPVTRFQKGEVPLFLISLKAGGVGLNLTAADTVIHYDPWWNPAVEQQATDRAHRIGQDKPVFVYKLLTEGTVEEKITALQARKRELAAALFQEGGGALGLGPEDLAELFAPLAG